MTYLEWNWSKLVMYTIALTPLKVGSKYIWITVICTWAERERTLNEGICSLWKKKSNDIRPGTKCFLSWRIKKVTLRVFGAPLVNSSHQLNWSISSWVLRAPYYFFFETASVRVKHVQCNNKVVWCSATLSLSTPSQGCHRLAQLTPSRHFRYFCYKFRLGWFWWLALGEWCHQGRVGYGVPGCNRYFLRLLYS